MTKRQKWASFLGILGWLGIMTGTIMQWINPVQKEFCQVIVTFSMGIFFLGYWIYNYKSRR